MELQEITPGLWRWTAPHPDWVADADPDSPDGWDRDVGCVLLATEDATILIDPLVADEAGAWEPLDDVVRARGRPVVVLTTIAFHDRSRDAVLARYDGAVLGEPDAPPAGVEAIPLPDAGETMFWLPGPRALVPGDRLLGDSDGGVRPSPESWTGYMPRPLAAAELRALLTPLLDLPVERVLVSHGDPVLRDGRAALARALEGA
ncbi:hypothetical protein AB0L40_07535 [Patulibacter sp. NPDC049589]|uniref:hypothetical protein n=1 Tax=Patulibacter sp. NPDC049589 TaxID=3154731 RepID=UPI003434D922